MLRTEQEWDADQLDAASSPDLEHSPANGGWFAGPGGWLLLIEGLPDKIQLWLDEMATRLNAAGVDGTLTGAPRARTPRWAHAVHDTPALTANIGFQVEPDHGPYGGWGGISGSRAAAVDTAIAWLTRHGGQILALGEMDSQFWVNPSQARQNADSS